ncbi:MAG: hypothetical protein WC608_03950 [Parcubacteria group bacterium]
MKGCGIIRRKERMTMEGKITAKEELLKRVEEKNEKRKDYVIEMIEEVLAEIKKSPGDDLGKVEISIGGHDPDSSYVKEITKMYSDAGWTVSFSRRDLANLIILK